MVAAINSVNPYFVNPVQMNNLYAFNTYASKKDWAQENDLELSRQQRALRNINAFSNDYQSSYILQTLHDLGLTPSGNIDTDLSNIANALSEMYIQASSQDDRLSVMETIRNFQNSTGVKVCIYNEDADKYIQSKIDERRNQILMSMNNVAEMNKYFMVNKAS